MKVTEKKIESFSILLILVALISSQLSGIEVAFSYDKYVTAFWENDASSSLFVIFREMSYVFLSILIVLYGMQFRSILFLLVSILLFLVILIIRSYLVYENINLIAYGLRLIVLILMGFSVFIVASSSDRLEQFLMSSIFVLCVLWSFSSIWQLNNYQSPYGETIFGPRINGTYINPITFSMALGSSSLFLVYAKSFRRKGLVLLLLFGLALLTGGRAGIIVSLVSLVSYWTMRRGNYNYLLLVTLPLLFITVSFSEISGRVGTEKFFLDGRLNLWADLLADFFEGGSGNFILGQGLGVGTNASRVADHFSHVIADSALVTGILNFGVIYFLLYISFIVFPLYRYGSFGVPLFISLLIYSLAQNLPELHPTFLLVMAAWGILEKRKHGLDF